MHVPAFAQDANSFKVLATSRTSTMHKEMQDAGSTLEKELRQAGDSGFEVLEGPR
jgi:hypothetical protein